MGEDTVNFFLAFLCVGIFNETVTERVLVKYTSIYYFIIVIMFLVMACINYEAISAKTIQSRCKQRNFTFTGMSLALDRWPVAT